MAPSLDLQRPKSIFITARPRPGGGESSERISKSKEGEDREEKGRAGGVGSLCSLLVVWMEMGRRGGDEKEKEKEGGVQYTNERERQPERPWTDTSYGGIYSMGADFR